MSTTAQDEQTTQAPPAPQASPPAQPTQAPQTSSRSYTVFEEARTDTWTKIGEFEADSQEAALEALGEQKLKAAQGRFLAIPTRFVVPRKPKVTTQIQISFD